MNIQGWFPLGLTGLISLLSVGLSRVFSSTKIWSITSSLSLLHGTTLTSSQNYGKAIALTIWTFVGKVMSLLFNMLSRFVRAFLPKSKSLLILWWQSPSTVILESKKIKSVTISIVSPSIYHEVMGPDAIIFVFWIFSFKPAFWLSSFTFIKRFSSSSSFSAIRVVLSAYLKLLIFLLAILIPACASSSLTFCMIYIHTSYKLTKQLTKLVNLVTQLTKHTS